MAIPKLPSYDIGALTNNIENKANWSLNKDKTVLLIHDMQRYFTDFYGEKSELMNTLINNILGLKKMCKEQGIPVIYTAQPSDQSPQDRALLTDFWGEGLKTENQSQHIVEALSPEDGDICLTKWRYSAFQRTELHHIMKVQQRKQLLICGVYAHIGILTTCLEAFMSDIQSFVVADAVADFSEADHRYALQYISGRCGKVETMESVKRSVVSQTNTSSLSLQSMKEDIAQSLMMNYAEIDDDEDLLDLGLDSIRLMSLLELWRGKGANIQFTDLAESSRLDVWWSLVEASLLTQDVA